MSFLQLGDQQYPIPEGEAAIGSDAASFVTLAGSGVAPRHMVLRRQGDGQVAVQLGHADVEVHINGVRLGPQPTPLLHGDKIVIAGHELRFVDEERAGSTQFVRSDALPGMGKIATPVPKRPPTAATGGRLVCLTDGREYTMSGASLVFGRDASCDVVVPDRSVSRRHAEIKGTAEGYVLLDKSANGTFVNGKRIVESRVLVRADVVRVGDHEFRFYADSAPVAAPSASPPAQPPAGAQYRLGDTLHGIPDVPPRPPVSAPPPPPVRRPPPPATAPSRPAAAALASLVVRSGSLKGQRFSIRVPVVNLGRADYNDIVLSDTGVSASHAKIQRREGIWVLVDLESTNGTFVDGEQVQGEAPLAPGSVIRFGSVTVIFDPRDEGAGPEQGGTRLMGAIDAPAPSAPPGDRPGWEGGKPTSTPSGTPKGAEEHRGRRLWPFK